MSGLDSLLARAGELLHLERLEDEIAAERAKLFEVRAEKERLNQLSRKIRQSLDDSLLNRVSRPSPLESSILARRQFESELSSFDHRKDPYYIEERDRIMGRMINRQQEISSGLTDVMMSHETRLRRINEELLALERTPQYFDEPVQEVAPLMSRRVPLELNLPRSLQPLLPDPYLSAKKSLNRLDLILPEVTNRVQARRFPMDTSFKNSSNVFDRLSLRPSILGSKPVSNESSLSLVKPMMPVATSSSSVTSRAPPPPPPPPVSTAPSVPIVQIPKEDPYDRYHKKPIGNIVGKRAQRIRQQKLALKAEAEKNKADNTCNEESNGEVMPDSSTDVNASSSRRKYSLASSSSDVIDSTTPDLMLLEDEDNDDMTSPNEPVSQSEVSSSNEVSFLDMFLREQRDIATNAVKAENLKTLAEKRQDKEEEWQKRAEIRRRIRVEFEEKRNEQKEMLLQARQKILAEKRQEEQAKREEERARREEAERKRKEEERIRLEKLEKERIEREKKEAEESKLKEAISNAIDFNMNTSPSSKAQTNKRLNTSVACISFDNFEGSSSAMPIRPMGIKPAPKAIPVVKEAGYVFDEGIIVKDKEKAIKMAKEAQAKRRLESILQKVKKLPENDCEIDIDELMEKCTSDCEDEDLENLLMNKINEHKKKVEEEKAAAKKKEVAEAKAEAERKAEIEKAQVDQVEAKSSASHGVVDDFKPIGKIGFVPKNASAGASASIIKPMASLFDPLDVNTTASRVKSSQGVVNIKPESVKPLIEQAAPAKSIATVMRRNPDDKGRIDYEPERKSAVNRAKLDRFMNIDGNKPKPNSQVYRPIKTEPSPSSASAQNTSMLFPGFPFPPPALYPASLMGTPDPAKLLYSLNVLNSQQASSSSIHSQVQNNKGSLNSPQKSAEKRRRSDSFSDSESDDYSSRSESRSPTPRRPKKPKRKHKHEERKHRKHKHKSRKHGKRDPSKHSKSHKRHREKKKKSQADGENKIFINPNHKDFEKLTKELAQSSKTRKKNKEKNRKHKLSSSESSDYSD